MSTDAAGRHSGAFLNSGAPKFSPSSGLRSIESKTTFVALIVGG